MSNILLTIYNYTNQMMGSAALEMMQSRIFRGASLANFTVPARTQFCLLQSTRLISSPIINLSPSRTYYGPTIKWPLDKDWAKERKENPEAPLPPRKKDKFGRNIDIETVPQNRQRHRERILKLFPEYAAQPNKIIDMIGTGPSQQKPNKYFGVPLNPHRKPLRSM